ncbi:MAG: anaerobic ribonucleoside-triphosphate reductase activating protein [Atopobiaceae bacterium]|nr:anaerobic ribonucleoside-triphosphate reductase activating protein [Atopobiaceae bacterium]
MNFAEIKYCDIANGTGVRTSLFVSGCRHRCPGCFNEVAWDFMAGEPFTADVEDRIIESLQTPYVEGLSILGGEPLEPENQAALLPFLDRMAQVVPNKDVWLWTGFTWEQLVQGDGRVRTPYLAPLLKHLSTLVDGPFVEEKKDITLRFRGSSNQRIIDVAASLASNSVVLWQDGTFFSKRTW